MQRQEPTSSPGPAAPAATSGASIHVLCDWLVQASARSHEMVSLGRGVWPRMPGPSPPEQRAPPADLRPARLLAQWPTDAAEPTDTGEQATLERPGEVRLAAIIAVIASRHMLTGTSTHPVTCV